jgi:hypothetical protein
LTDADLRKLYVSQLMRAKPDIVRCVPTGPDASLTSYFEDILAPEAIVEEPDLITSLIDLWREQRLDMLVTLEPAIRKMAKALRAPEAQSESVSSFIYPMY